MDLAKITTKWWQVIILALLSVTILLFVENVLEANYIIKVLVKICFFTLLPLLIILKIEKRSIKDVLSLENKNNYKYGLIIGIITFGLIVGLFFIVKSGIDFDSVKQRVDEYEITKNIFIFVAIYICFGNALLEEFYFRGYLFGKLQKKSTLLAYAFSSVLFSVYHLAIFITWFNIGVFMLAFLGLIFAGVFFSYVNHKSKNFINSYIIHIFADIALMVVGYYVLYVT